MMNMDAIEFYFEHDILSESCTDAWLTVIGNIVCLQCTKAACIFPLTSTLVPRLSLTFPKQHFVGEG